MRFVVGVVLVITLAPLSVDDYFRVYHALYFWQRPSFSPSTNWLPLYSWLYGAFIGLTGNTMLVPRALSFVVGICGAVAGARDAESGEERLARMLVAACIPTSVVLFSLPLSEALFGALIATHVSALARYVMRGLSVDALVAAVTMLAASATRYESWIMLPLSILVLASRRPVDAERSVVFVLAVLAGIFPIRWMLFLDERVGDPFSFVSVIQRDHLGASTVREAFLGRSAPFALTFILALAVLVHGSSTRRPQRVRIASAYGLLFAGFIGVLVLRGSLPSQLPLRLFHVPVLLAVPALVSTSRIAASPARTAFACALGMAIGLAPLGWFHSVVSAEAVTIGDALRRRLERDSTVSAVVDGPFPEVAYFVVAASAVGRVHVDGAGGRCPVRVLDCEFVCPPPRWVRQVRYALVASPRRETQLTTAGFRIVARAGRHSLLERAAGRSVCPDSLPAR